MIQVLHYEATNRMLRDGNHLLVLSDCHNVIINK